MYVAMGDSVAAGAGLPPLAGATSQDELCDRSSEAYPYLIADSLQTTVVQLSCSGAKVDEGIYGTQVRSGVRVPAQLPIAFSNGTPDLMTFTIGANDIRWTQFIRQCYITRCGFAVDSARTKIYRADLRIELTRMLNQINSRSAGNPPRVLISGYYSPIASTECLPSNRITTAESAWLSDQTVRMNQAINSVIPLFSFAEFVPLDFTGHELCSADPWVQGLEAAAPIHPTADGQAAIAQSFLGALGR
jgi:lysophospholipase L1-like esterase